MTCTRRSRACRLTRPTNSPPQKRGRCQLTATDPQGLLDLVDWRRRVGDLYRVSGPDAISRFRKGRDELFRTHPQSPIEHEERHSFAGLHYFPHDPAYRLVTPASSPARGQSCSSIPEARMGRSGTEGPAGSCSDCTARPAG